MSLDTYGEPREGEEGAQSHITGETPDGAPWTTKCQNSKLIPLLGWPVLSV